MFALFFEFFRECVYIMHVKLKVKKYDHTLASKYDFSGGQIENIARHYAIDTILHGTSDDILPMLIRHCDNERLDEKNKRKIGFYL